MDHMFSPAFRGLFEAAILQAGEWDCRERGKPGRDLGLLGSTAHSTHQAQEAQEAQVGLAERVTRV